MENGFLYLIEGLAMASHLIHLALAALAIFWCATLFHRQRSPGWLLVSLVYFEPIMLVIIRAFRGRPLLAYKTMTEGSVDATGITYHLSYPFFYIISVIGLFMLVRASRRNTTTNEPTK